jgi:hypothetical protein
MGFSPEDLHVLDAMFEAGTETDSANGFRHRFPRFSLTRCDASEIDSETPFRKYPQLNLYLVDASDHCWRITPDPTRATGVVVARHRTAT